MPQQINFEGQEYTFPDDASNEEISTALGKLNVQVKSTEPKTDQKEEDALFQQSEESELLADENAPTTKRVSDFKQESLNPEERTFRDKIVEVETGGLSNKYARTSIKPKDGEKGSSAYGPAQITKGLLVEFLTKRGKMFTDDEVKAMLELVDRQKVSLKIGGRDRADYEEGGTHAAYGAHMAEQYGYDTVEEFLEAFDYAGDLGLSKDTKFKLQYENFSRKMLKATLKDAKGDQLLAASVWHGGEKWKTSSSKGDTARYRDKFNRI